MKKRALALSSVRQDVTLVEKQECCKVKLQRQAARHDSAACKHGWHSLWVWAACACGARGFKNCLLWRCVDSVYYIWRPKARESSNMDAQDDQTRKHLPEEAHCASTSSSSCLHQLHQNKQTGQKTAWPDNQELYSPQIPCTGAPFTYYF